MLSTSHKQNYSNELEIIASLKIFKIINLKKYIDVKCRIIVNIFLLKI